MANDSAGGFAVPLIATGVGGFYAFRVIRQLGRRATNPDLPDPARNLMRWLQVLAVFVLALIVGAAALLFASMGAVAAIFVIPLALLVCLIALAVAVYLWAFAEGQRRSSGYMICEMHYPDASRQTKASMRRIYRSGRSVQTGKAYQDGLFGEVELDRLVYSAAARAVLSSDLASAIRDLRSDASGEDRTALDEANAQIKEIEDYLSDVEAALKRAATEADELSKGVSEPERQRESVRQTKAKVVAQDDRRQRARDRLDEAKAKAEFLHDVDADEVIERISAVRLGFVEARDVSDSVLNPRMKSVGSETTKERSDDAGKRSDSASSGDAFLRAASASAGKVGRLSAAAARASTRKLREKKRR